MQRVWPGDEAQEEELGSTNLVHVIGRELVGHPVRIVAEVQLSAVLPIEQRHRAETVDGRHERAPDTFTTAKPPSILRRVAASDPTPSNRRASTLAS